MGVCVGAFLSLLARMRPLTAALRDKNKVLYASTKRACFVATPLFWKLESSLKKKSRGTSMPTNNPI